MKLIILAAIGWLVYVAAGQPTLNQVSHNSGAAIKSAHQTVQKAERAFERGFHGSSSRNKDQSAKP